MAIEDDDLEVAESEEPVEQEPTDIGDWDPARQVIDDLTYAQRRYGRWHELIREEVEFVLDQKQWDEPEGHGRGDEDLQAVDQSLLSACRRKWSQIKGAPIYLTCYPTNYADADPFAAERMKWALEHEIYSPKKLFRQKRGRAIIGTVVGRIWYMHMEWNARLKEICHDTMPASDVYKQPGSIDLHDPACGWVVIRKRIAVQDARERARLRGLDEETVLSIVADSDGAATETQTAGSPKPGMDSLDHANPEGGPASGIEGTCILLIGMYRYDPKQAVVEDALGPPEKLPAEEQYMRCWTCGLEVQDHAPDAETGELPATGMPCPQCSVNPKFDGADETDLPMLERVDTVERVERYPECPDGRWIEVLEESRLVLYNDAWPYMKPDGTGLRSFPIWEGRIYDDPRWEIPHSDVSWQFNQQALATHILQWGVEQMRTSGRIIIMPRGALVDSRGRQITPTNRLDQIAYLRDPMFAKAIQEFQPAGLAQGWSELLATVTSSFRSNLGTGELGLGPEQSRDLPVGTVHAIVESGDIPVDDAIAMIRDADALYFGVMADMIQCCWDEARWVRYLGPEGQMAYEYISAADVTGVDVEVMGAPGFDAVQGAKMERMMQWFNLLPPAQRLAAKWLNLPPTEVQQYQQDMAAYTAAMAPTGPTDEDGVGGSDESAGGQDAVPGAQGLPPDTQAGLESMALSQG